MTSTTKILKSFLLALLLAACGREDEMPPPVPCAMWPFTITAGVNDSVVVSSPSGFTAYRATVAAGTYLSPADLAAAVRVALQAAWANGWTVTPTASGRLTITGSASFILWPAADNRLVRSQEFNLWTKAAMAAVTANATNGPDATATADKLIEGPGGPFEFYVSQADAGSVKIADGETVTVSVFAKAAERSFIALQILPRGGSPGKAFFNLATGATSSVSAGVTARAVDIGGGWWRCAITMSAGTGASNVETIIYLASDGSTTNYAGVAGNGVYLWGAQMEKGADLGPYIPTTAAAADAPARSALPQLGVPSGPTAAGTSVTGANQVDNCWFADDAVADDSFDRPVKILRSQTRALSGKVRTRTFSTAYERAISLAFLNPYKVFISEEGAAHTNEALERLFIDGAERLRWFPDATDFSTFADYVLDAGVVFDPRRLSPGAALYSQSLRLLRYIA